MGFFKKIKSFALPAIGFAIGGPAGAAVGSGVADYTTNHNLLSALASGAGSYAGSAIGGSIGESLGLGSIGDFSSAAGAGNAFGIEGAIGSSIANTGIGSLIGGAYGSSNAASAATPAPQMNAAGPTPFQPKQDAAQDRPLSLSGMGGLTPQQESTNLATQGTYGGGLGPQEQAYFLNMQNRKLVDESGQTQGLDQLSPIEQSYLQKLGFGGYANSNDLLEAISKWKQSA